MQELRHFAASFLGLLFLGSAQQAAASPTTKPTAPCTVSSQTVLAPGTTIFTEAKGNEAAATLPGAAVFLRVRLPTDNKTMPPRLAVETYRKGGYLRIAGWIATGKLSFFAKQSIPLKGRTIVLSQGMRVRPEATAAGKIRFTHSIVASPQKIAATTPCSALSLKPKVATIVVPSKAHSYQMRKGTIELFVGPEGKASHPLELVGESRKVFWSDESKGAYIHVHSYGDITINAWAKRSSIVRLRASELFNMAAITPRLPPPRVLNIKDAPALVTAKHDIAIYSMAGGKGKKIGTLESGSRYYPMEQAHDWVNIYPDDLAVFPSSGFWIKEQK